MTLMRTLIRSTLVRVDVGEKVRVPEKVVESAEMGKASELYRRTL